MIWPLYRQMVLEFRDYLRYRYASEKIVRMVLSIQHEAQSERFEGINKAWSQQSIQCLVSLTISKRIIQADFFKMRISKCASNDHAPSAGEAKIENCPPQSAKLSIFPRIAVLSIRVGCLTSSVVARPVWYVALNPQAHA